MPYEDKPLLPEIANADVGDVVILEEVTVMRELWRGGNENGIGMTLVEKAGSEGVVKNFDGSILPVGKVITVVGTKTKYKDKYSVEVREKSGGGIALDGEPLASVAPVVGVATPVQQAPAPAAAPRGVIERKMNVDEYREMKTQSFDYWADVYTKRCEDPNAVAENARSESTSEMIAVLRKDIVEVPEDDGIPF